MSMSLRPLFRLALLACLATTLSCAASDPYDTYSPEAYAAPPAQSAARMGLDPAYRAFYDALEGEGDWTLIEPWGWVFRPRVNFDSWRPYQQGWWEPSDAFGWIWYSDDPFGWVTDHYGSWFYDSYQGWVWQPGPVWGPAWVAWVSAGDYIGWAPLGPTDYDGYSQIPGAVFTYTSAQQFGSMTSNSQALFVMRPPVADRPVSEISNFVRRGRIAFNRGPDAVLLQRLGGIMAPPPDEPNVRRVKLPDFAPPGESELLQRTSRAVAAGRRELAQSRVSAPIPVPSAPKMKSPAPAPTPKAEPGGKDAARDSVAAPAPRVRTPKRDPRPPGPRKGSPGHPGAKPDSTRG
jgi:hypothetical protein